MAVYVLDKQGKPLMPCSEKRARLMLARGRARVHRLTPFVIRLVDRTLAGSEFQALTLKLDPGSRFTGIALVRQVEGHVAVLNLMELVHRGLQIKKALQQRAGHRRRRRSQNLRHRAPRFDNRTRPAGWLAGWRHHCNIVLIPAWSGSTVSAGVVQGIGHRYCLTNQRADGYGYSLVPTEDSQPQEVASMGHAMRDALSLPGLKAEVARANG